jgi:6-phosphofructokinase 1
MSKRRIGILTGGGDCPGLNAVIRAITKTAILKFRMEVIGFLDGFNGLVEDRYMELTFDSVSNILTQGGTILGTSSRDHLFQIPSPSKKNPTGPNRLHDALRVFQKHRLNKLICIGGDGTLTVAHTLQRYGIPVIGVPKTIDNDVHGTDITFGFDSARTVATEAVDRLHTTAASHHRIMVVEVMGRHAGWIALHAGLAGGGDVILIPEIPFSLAEVCRVVWKRSQKGRRFSLVVIAEGAHPKGKSPVVMCSPAMGHRPRLGGVGIALAEEIEQRTGLEARATILGHLQRGGTPTPFDRVLATQFGYAAACLANREGGSGKMVCWKKGAIWHTDLKEAAGRSRTVPLNSPLIAAAKAVGTSFGV